MGQKRILIGEDSSVILNLAKKILQFQNYDIDVAKNGKEVLDKMQKEEYDLLLLDITMPVIDGVQCIHTIRRFTDKDRANIPIIGITGNAANYSGAEFEVMGFNMVLKKPLDFDHLVEVVNQYLAPKKS